MKNHSRIYLVVTLFAICTLLCCTTKDKEPQKTNPLEGVWEYVESFTPDTTYTRSPDFKAYKILHGEHWALAGQDHSRELNYGHAGKSRITEDTYVEYLEVVRAPEYVGDSAVFTYTLDGDFWTITREGYSEKWKRVK